MKAKSISYSASSLFRVMKGVLLTKATLGFVNAVDLLVALWRSIYLSNTVACYRSCLVEVCKLFGTGVDLSPSSSSINYDLRFSGRCCLFGFDFSLLLICRTLKAKLGVSLR